MCQRQGAQSLRNETYFCVGRSNEGCRATQHMAHFPMSLLIACFYICPYPFNNGIKRSTWCKNSFNARVVKHWKIVFRNNPTANDDNVGSIFFSQQLNDSREKHSMSARKATQPHQIDIFLNCRCHNLFRRLMTACINNLKTGVTEAPRQNTGATVM